MRSVILGLLLVYVLTACQAFAPEPIPALPGQPPVRSGPVPTAPQALTPTPSATGGGGTVSPLPVAEGRGEGLLTVALPREPLTLDPGDVADAVGLVILGQLFDTLTQFRSGSAEIEPGLATAWEANADATEWTFTLREGVKFHDGAPLTAEAVKFNFDRWLEPGFKAGYRAQGKQFQVWSDVFGGYRGAGSLVTDVEVVDSTHIRLKLSRPAAYLPSYLALPYFGLSSPAAVERMGAHYGAVHESAVGSGPYRLTVWATDRVELERFDDYWGDRAATPRVTFRVIGESDAQLSAVSDGRADLAPSLEHADFNREGVTLITRPQLAVAYLSINQRYRPLDNPQVREALQVALDPTMLAKRAFTGASAPADQFVPPELWGRLSRPEGFPPAGTPQKPSGSVQSARSLLTEAGFPSGLTEVAGPDGVARPLELWFSQTPRGTPFTGLAEAVAEQLGAAGIKIVLREDDWASFLAERRQGRFPLYLLVHPLPSARVEAVGDPHLFLSGLFGPLTAGDTSYTSEVITRQLREAEVIADMTRRAELYREIAQILQADRPRIPLVYPTGLAAVRQAWIGFIPSPVGADRLAGVRRKD